MPRNILLIVIITMTAAAAGSPAAAQRGIAPQMKEVVCTVAGKGDVGIGWREDRTDARYRCTEVFDASFKPAGAAWVKVEPDGTIGRMVSR